MRKRVFILNLMLSFGAYAEIISTGSCGDACTWTFDADTKELSVFGTGNMYSYIFDTENPSEDGDACSRPWFKFKNLIENIKIGEGNTSVGRNAFFDFPNLKNVELPQTLQEIEPGGFQSCSSLVNINLVDGMTIDHLAFTESRLASIVIPRDSKLEQTAFCYQGSHCPKTIYCSSDMAAACQSAIDFQNDVSMKFYEFNGGVYVLKDEEGNEIYYISADDMRLSDQAESIEEKSEYACHDTLSNCKKKALINRGICAGNDCDALVAADDANRLLKVGSKTYRNINALLKNDYDRRRIYTIEEANFVAGKKNRVSIKYR